MVLNLEIDDNGCTTQERKGGQSDTQLKWVTTTLLLL